MLRAVIQDALRLDDCDVLTTWDQRLGSFPISHPRLTVRLTNITSEASAFRELAEQADDVLVIAPEFQNRLVDRLRCFEAIALRSSGRPRILGCESTAAALCADKLKLASHLQSCGIATLATARFDVSSRRLNWPFPMVIKPRDGAGSQLTFRIDDDQQLATAVAQIEQAGSGFEFIQQPFIGGRALGMSAIVGTDIAPREKADVQTFPITEQVLSADGRFTYLGSDLNAACEPDWQGVCDDLVGSCCRAVPGLRGYVGFDLILPEGRSSEPVLVEINPRLTTSYLAYRELADFNLVAAILGRCRATQWQRRDLRFRLAEDSATA